VWPGVRCLVRELSVAYCAAQSLVDYNAMLRGVWSALRDCPCTAQNTCRHLALQFERVGFDKAQSLLQRLDVHRSGEIEWGQMFQALQEVFVDLTASQLAALMSQYVSLE
jgi:hypothetical protein